MVTKEERWTHETAQKAQQLIGTAGQAGGALADLKQILPNIEARWKDMAKEEQYAVFRQLEEVQKKDWKELSIDEKKAGVWNFFSNFGCAMDEPFFAHRRDLFTTVSDTAVSYSILRCIRPPWPSHSCLTSRNQLQGRCCNGCTHWGCRSDVCWFPRTWFVSPSLLSTISALLIELLSSTCTSQNYDEGVARGNQRISTG